MVWKWVHLLWLCQKMDLDLHQPWGLMVKYGGLVQTDMGLNMNQRLCSLLMVLEITANSFDDVILMSRMVVVHLLGMRKSVGDQLC